jgi:hypothetical protein
MTYDQLSETKMFGRFFNNAEKLLETYTADLIDRALTKPHRITEEIKKDLSHFLKSMPIRIMTKPYRVAREVGDILHKEKDKK